MKLANFTANINGENIDLSFRTDSVGDKGVLQQIFVDEDYRIIHWAQGRALLEYYQARQNKGARALIVDAGANIGASAVYFSKLYPASVVLAVEPQESNVNLMRVNVDKLNVKVFHAAIGCENGTMYLHDPGQSDWAFRVGETGEVPVNVLSPTSIMESVKDQDLFPFIFKIDIEGGEGNLFRQNIEWVDTFPLIVIELHDWMLPFQGSSRNFFKAIAAHDFDVVYRGENVFCFNKRILAP
jgi:FkbM family methyltransferase